MLRKPIKKADILNNLIISSGKSWVHLMTISSKVPIFLEPSGFWGFGVLGF